MRIISGKFKGRKLIEFKTKQKKDLRPTSDRNRESLFNILTNSAILKELGFNLEGSFFLDGFCGTGAVGLEAVSRGAKFVSFVDINREHLNIAKQNAKILNVDEGVEFICADLTKTLKKSEKEYDLVFLDPPYKNSILHNVINNLIQLGYIKHNTILVIEYEKKFEIEKIEGIRSLDKRQYGKTIFEFFTLI